MWKRMVANLLMWTHLDFRIETFFRQCRMGKQKSYDVRFQFGPRHNVHIICKRMATYSESSYVSMLTGTSMNYVWFKAKLCFDRRVSPKFVIRTPSYVLVPEAFVDSHHVIQNGRRISWGAKGVVLCRNLVFYIILSRRENHDPLELQACFVKWFLPREIALEWKLRLHCIIWNKSGNLHSSPLTASFVACLLTPNIYLPNFILMISHGRKSQTNSKLDDSANFLPINGPQTSLP